MHCCKKLGGGETRQNFKSSFTDNFKHVFDMYVLVHVFYINVHYKSLLFKIAS